MTVLHTITAQQAKPLSEQDVIELLQGGVPSARVGELVDERGINFDFTAAIEQKVRDAGGADDAVAALRRASRRNAPSEQPRSGGLVIKTTPGETQVYLNDEPKGMTSPEGELRLPDLQPGTYKLRVSMPGYQSYEKPMSVRAGEPQKVYITLVQKSSAAPSEDNRPPAKQAPPGTTPATGLPIPGVKVSPVQFYESPHDAAVEKSQRVYGYSFDRFTTRSIYWELDLAFPPPGQRIDFSVEAFWYKSDGSEMTRQTIAAFVNPDWGTSWHTLGFGFVEPGHWIPGTYRVDLYFQNRRIASGAFQIN
jgi:hypothetical protein